MISPALVMQSNASSPKAGLEQDVASAVGEQLDRYLGPEYLSYRRGEGGRMLAYVEGHEVISQMNCIFGWQCWSSKVVSFATDYADVSNGGKWSVGVAATVRVTVQRKPGGNEVSHEDVGYGTMENAPSRGKAMEKCRKEAVTDGLKRAARQFGNATGGCLYNREYLESVKRVKGPATRISFVEEELYRKPVNRRKRHLMQQEMAEDSGAVLREGDVRELEEYGDDLMDEGAMRELVESEELVTI